MMVGHQTRHPWRAPTVPVFGPSRPIRPTAWGLLPINALGSGRWVVRRRSPHHSREVPIPERSGTAFRPKFLTGSDGILLIRQEIIQSSISNYWQQGEQRIGLGLQRSRLWHLLKAWGGVFRFQPIGHACSTG